MIIVTYSKSHIYIKGHANADIKGKDIVCSAISALTITAINSLEGFTKSEIKSKDGEVTINIKHKISNDDQIRLDMMILGIKLIAKKYPKFVKIKKEK